RLCTTFPLFFHAQLITANQLTPTTSRHHLYGEEGCARHSHLFFHAQLITANQLTPTTSRHHLYMGKKVVHDIPTYFFMHNSSPPINLHPQHLAIIFIWGRRLCTTFPPIFSCTTHHRQSTYTHNISPSSLYGEEGCARHSHLFFHAQLITANQLTPTTSRHHLYMGKKVVHDIPTYFSCTTHHRQSTYTHNISPSSLYGEEGCARHSHLFFHAQLITANQLTPTTSRHHLYMGKKVVHDIPPIFSCTTHHRQSTYTHNISPSSLYGEEGCARHSHLFFHAQLITANQLTPTTSRHHLYMGKKVVHDIPPIFSCTTHHRQSTYTHNISPSSLYGEEGCARHSHLFFHAQLITANQLTPTTSRHHLYMGKKVVHDIPPIFHAQLITANQLTPTTSRHHLYMGKKVVHDIPTYFFMHNSSPPINLHPQHLAIIFIWGRRLCTTFPPIFSCTTHHRQSTYTHNISPSSLYGEEGCARHSPYFFMHNSSPPINLHPQHLAIIFIWGRRLCTTFPPIFSCTTHHRQSTYTHNISPSSLYGEEGCARHSTYFFMHNSSPPINLHPQHLAIIFIWGRRLCTTSHLFFHAQLITANQLTPTTSRHHLYMGKKVVHDIPPIFSCTTHHRQSTYTHNISPSSLYGEEGCARHSHLFFHAQLITANQLTPTTSRHHLYMGKKVVHDIPTYFSCTTHHRQSTYTHNISPSSLYGEEGCARHSHLFFHAQLITANQLTPTTSRHHLYMGKKVVHDIPPIFSCTTHHRQSTYTHNISPSSLYGEEEGCARHSHLFFHAQLITANQLTPTTSRHHLYMGKKVVHDIPHYFSCTTHHRQSTYTHNISPSSLYGEEGCARHSHLFFHAQLITANQLTPTTSRHHLYMGKKVVHDIPTYFSCTTHHRQSTYTHNISPSSLYGEEGCARHSHLFFHAQLITANQLTPTTSRHHLYMGKKVVHDIPPIFSCTTHHRQSTYTHNISPSSLYGEEGCARHSTYFFMHNSSPPINLHPQHLAIIFIWGRRLCTTFPPIFSCTTHHRQSTYTHNISPSSLYGEEGCARHSTPIFSCTTHHRQSTYTHNISPSSLYGEEGCARHSHLFFMHNSSPPINLHPQHLAIIFIWGRRLCTTFPPIFSCTTHHRQSTYTHNISPSSLYGEEGCARHSHLFFHAQLITANQLTPTTSRHHLYMGKKVVHDIPPYFFMHNSSPPINLHPQHLAIIFIWGRRLCTTFPPIFSCTTHHRQSTYTHNISPSSLYGEEGCARHSTPIFSCTTHHRQSTYTHNISPSSLYGEEGCARHSHLFFHAQLITANQLTPTTSRHHLYMGKKVVHDIPTYFFMHNSSPPINLHPQHLAIIFIWGRRLCTTFPPIFSCTTHHRQSTYTHNISPSSLYGEEGCARHSHLFFHAQLITANQLTPTTSRHHLYMGKKVVHDIPPIFSCTTHHRQSTYTHNISPSSLYGEEGCARHSHLFFHAQLITANQLTPTTSRHHLYMGKKVVHDIPTYFFMHNSSPPINLHPQHLAIIFIWGRRLCTTFTLFFHAQLITANQLTPTTSRHHLYMGKKVVHDIPTYFFMHNSSPPINLHPQHLAIIFIWGRRLCTTSHLFFHAQLITANQLTPTTSRHHLYMGKKVVHDIHTYFFMHNSSPPINLHPQHLAIIFIWGRRLCTTFTHIFSCTTHHRQSTYTHNISPSSLYGEEGCARHSHLFFMHNSSPPINLHPQHLAIIFIWGRRLCTTFPPIFSCTTHHRQSTYTHNISPSSLYGEEGCARHSPYFFMHNSSPPINLHPQHLAIIFIWGRRLCTTFPLFFHAQLITANQLTPTTSRHHLYMGKKVVHDIPTYFFMHNSSPPINLHPQHLAIIFIWGRRLCTTFPPIFSCTTHHRQSTYTHNISPSSLYGEEGCARHSPYFFMHNSSPPINLHPQHLAIIFIWGRRLCTTFPPIFSCTTHHRQSTYTHNISPSSLYGEEGCARHSHLFFHAQLITANQLTPTTSRHHLYMGKKVVHDIPLFFHAQLITANQLTPTTSRHHLYMGKKVVHDIPTYFFMHNSSPPINLHPQHLAIIFIWGRRLCTTFPPIFSCTTHHRQSTYTHNISPSSLYGEEGCARHSHLFFHAQLITANQLTPTTSRHHLYMGKKVVHDIPPIFSCTTHHRQSTYTHNISPSSLYGEEGCARHSHLFFHAQLITANQLTPTTSRHHLYMGRRLCTTSHLFFHAQLITANQLTPTTSRHHLYMGKKVVHDIPTYFFMHNSSPPINLHPQHLAIIFIWGRRLCTTFPLFFHAQLITANQLTPTTSRHHLYMGKKVVHDIPTYFFMHNSSPPINLHPQHLAIIFIWGRRLCTTFPPIFSCTTHHRQSTYTHNISPSSLYGEEGCARHSPYFFMHNSSPPINLHPQHLAIIFIWGRRLCTTFPPIFSCTTHHRQSTYTHNISPSSLYGEEGCARHSHLFFHAQLITANQLTPTTSRHHLYMGKKVVHDIPTYFFMHNSSPPINLHPQHLAIIFIWGRRLCTTFPPIFSCTTHHRQSTYTHNISPSSLYGEEGCARHSPYFFMHNSSPPINLHPQHLAIIFIWGRRLCTTFPPIFSCTTHHRQSTYTHNISPSSLYGEEGCARHSHLFFHAQLITANQLTPTTSRHHLYMGKKVVHDIPPIFSCTTHHRQSTYTHNISPSSLYGEEGCARHSHLFFHAQLITANQLTPTTSRHHLYMGKKVVHDIPTYFFMHNSSPPINLHPQHLAIIFIWGRRLCTTFPLFFHAQLITANQLTPTTSRHHLYMGKKVVHDIPTYFFMHNSSPPINLHPQHLAIIFIWGRRLCTTFPPIFSCTTHHRQSTYTHNISPSSLYGEEGCARHSHLFFHAQLITANQLTPTTSRHHLYMGKKVVHDIPPIFSCTTHHRQSTYTHNISPSSLYGEEGCARHSTYFFMHNSSPPINLHPQHLAIIFIWGRRRLCTTFPPIFSCTTHHRQSTYTHNISPSSLYGEEGCARHSHLFFHAQLITANQLTPTTSRHHLYMGKKVVHDIPPIFSCTTHHRQSTYTHNISPSSLYGEEGCARHSHPIFSCTTHHRQSTYTHNISPSSLYGEEGCARHSHLFFHAQLITANQLTPTTSRHHLYMGKKVVHDIPTYFFMHNSSPPINLHPQHLAIIFIWGRRLCTTFHLFFHAQLITANQLTPTTSRHHLYMGKKVVHDIPPIFSCTTHHRQSTYTHNISPSSLYGEEGCARHSPYFFMHNSSPPINLHPQHLAIIFIWGRRLCTTFPPIFSCTTHHRQSTYTHNISPSSLYGEEGCARHSHLFFHAQLITANQLTPTTSRHHLYMGKKVVHDIPPIFSCTTHHRQSTYTHNISPSSLYGEEGCARHSHLFFHAQLITANQLTPTTSRHHLYMGKKVVHDIPTYFFMHNSSPPINLHPQHLAIIFIWGRRLCTTFPLFFHAQLITANQLTPTTSRHHLYMGKKVVHDIPTYFFMHNSSPPINLHPQHLAIIFIWGRRLCTTFPPIFSCTTHHRQSTYTHNISPSSLYGEEGCARHSHLFFHAQLITANQLTPTTSRHHLYMGKKVVHDIPPIFSCTTHHRQSTYTHNISPSSLYGEEGCARHSHLFFHAQLITANQLTPTTSRHHLYMGKKVVHDIPTYFFMHNSSPPINLHPQHLAIIFIWGRRLCTTFPPIFSCTTHHRQSTYTHNISPSSLYGEEGCARHSPLFFHAQLITANQLTPTTSRHHLYMGKKVVHDIPTYFFMHNSSPPINLHPQHLAIIFIWGRRLCTTFPPIFSCTTHHRQSTYTHNISPSSLYGEEGCARHSPYFFMHNSSPPINLHPQHLAIIFIWGRRLCTTFPPIFSCTTHHRQSTYTHNISPSSLYGEEGCARHSHLFFHAQLITANQLTPTTSRHHLYMGKKVVHDIPTYFFMHNSSPPINLHPQHLAIIFIWGRRLCTTFPPIFSCTTHHRQSTYTHNISPSSLYGEEEGCARHSHLFFHAQLITANQLTPTTSRHHLYMGKKVVHDIPTYFFMHNSSPPINLHPQHLAIIFIWGRRLCTTFPPIFSCTTHHRQSTYTHNISPSSLYGEEGCARHSPYFFMHNSSPPINLHPQHLAIIFIWGRRLCTTFPPIFSCTTHHRQSTYTHNISPSSLYGEEGCARHSHLFFHAQLITANQLTPTTSRHHLYMGKKVVHDIPPIFSCTTHHRQSTYTHNISPSSLYGEEGCARHFHLFFHAQLITANQLTPTTSRHHLYMGKKVVHDIPTYFFMHNSSPPINLHPQHLAIIFIWGRRLCTTFPPIFSCTTHHRQSTYTHNISPSSLYGEEGCARHSPYFFMHNSSPPINLHPQHLAIIFIWGRRLCTTFPPIFSCTTHHRQSTYTHNISPSSLYGEEGCARHSHLFFHAQLITANQLTPTTSRHHLYMGKKVVHDIPTYFFMHNSSPPINLHPQHLAIIFIWGRRLCTTFPLFFHAQLITANQLTPTTSRHHLYMGKKVVHDIPPIFSCTTHHRQSTYTHNISPSSLYGEEGCARHSHLFFHAQLITANQLTPTTSRHHLYMGKKVVHDIPTYFFMHNSSPPINLHPQHLAIIFIWGRRLCTTFPPIFSCTTHHRQSTYTHNISPSSLYGEEGCARHSHLFFHAQLITANQLTPTTSRHHLYMGKKVVHDIPPIFSCTTHHRQSTYTHNISPSSLYGEEEGCARHSHLFFHAQLITANQLTPTTSRHHLYMGKKVVHDIHPIFSCTTHHRQSTYTHNISPSSLYGEEGCARHSPYFFMHNSSPPINLHPQHLAIIFIWGRRLCTTFPPIFSCTTHHRQSTYTHNISPSSLYGEEGCARHSPYFFMHNSSPPINLHPQHLAIIFIWGRRLCTTFPPIFSCTTHHRQSTYTHNISPSSLYGEEGCARHSHLFFHAQLITANQLTPTTSRHHLYMGKKVVHDIPTYFFMHNSSPPINLHPQHLAIIFIWGRRRLCTTFPLFFHAQLITANQLTPTTSRHHLYMGKKVVHDIPTYFFMHNSSPPINLHPQHLAIIFIWGRRLCTTFPPIFSCTTHHRQSTYTHNISPSSLYGEEGCARHSPYFFMHNSSPPINLHPQHLAIIFIWGRRLCTTFPPIFSCTTHHRQSTYTHNISPSSLYGEEGCARHSHLFFHAQLITANQLTPTTSRHHLYMGKKVVHDIPTYFFMHNSSPPINLHPQHLAIIFIWGRRLCTTFPLFFHAQLITANQLTPTTSRHHLYMGKKVVHDIPTYFFMHNSSPPINLHPQHLAIIFIWGRRLCTTFPPIFSCTTHHRQSTYTHNISPSSLYGEEGCARHSHLFFHAQLITANQLTPTTSRHHLYMGKKVVHDIPPIFSCTTHHRQSTYTHNISPSSLYGEEGCARHSHLFFHAQLITANQLTPTTSRHHLYMGKKVVHDIPTYFFMHNSSPPINLHPQHLAIIFIWGRRLCTTFPPIFSCTTHHRQSTYTHNISPSSLYGEEGCARHSHLFFHAQLITANQLTPTTSRHHLYMGKKVVHDIPPIFSCTTHHRQSTYTHNISPSSLYGEEGCARHSHLFFHAQLITANQLTPTTSRHHLYMGKKVVHDIPTYFFMHNSSPPINLHPQHLAIIFIWGRRLCTTFPPIFSCTTHHRQSTYTHNISPSSLYGEEGCARHSPLFFHAQLITANQLTPTTSRHHLYMGKKVVHDIPPIFSCTTHHRQSTYTHNISPSSLYGEEGCARHSHLFFHAQLITANQLTPTTSRHHLYMGKKVVHDIPPIFSCTTHHRQSTYTHNISPSSLYGEEGCARHSHLFFHAQLITANQLTPTTSRHHLYMGKKVVHDIPTYFFMHNSSPPINLHPQHLAIIFIWGRRLCTTFPPIFSCTTHHRQSTYTHNISPSSLYGEEGCARHSPLFFHAQLITANQLTPTTSRHHLYMGKKVVHDIPPIFSCTTHHRQSTYTHNISPSSLYGEEGCARHSHLFFHAQLITANQLTPTTSRHHLYMGKKVVHDIPTYFFMHNSSPPINLHPQHLAIIFIWGRRLCTTFPLFFHAQLITANQLTPTTSRHHLYMGKKVVHDIPTYFFMHNSSPPINLHPQHLAIIFIWGRRLCTTFPPIFSCTTHHRQSTYTHNISPSSLYGEEGCARHSHLFFHAQLITANQLTPTTSRHHLYMGKKVVHDIPTYFFMHNSSPPINLHPQHLAIIFIWGRRLCTTFTPIFSCTTHHRQSTYTHNISPSSLYGEEEGCARHSPYFFMHNSSPPINLHPQHLAIIFIWGRRLCTTFPPIFSCTTHHRQSTYTHNISPSSLYGEEGCARHSHLFFHAQLITANQLTPTTSRHHLYMGKKVVHDIPTYFFMHNSSPPINLHPQHLAIIFIWGRRLCTTFPLFFHAQLITANQLTPTTSRHHLYMGKKVVHDISTYFFMHNSSPPINLHPQHLAIIFIWGRRLCTTFPPIFSCTTHHRQSTYTHNISPSSLYGEEGCARHSHLFFHAQLITANQLTPTTSRHHLYMGKKVVHDIHPYFFMHNSSPPINLHPQHLAIIFIWGRRLCTTFPPIFSCTTHHRQSTYTHNISPSSLYGEEGCARHSHLFFHAQLITANQLTPTTSRHHLYMGKKVVHDIPTYFFMHNSSPPINLHPQHLAIIFIWGRRLCTTFPPNIPTYFLMHNSSPPINLHPQHLAIIFIWGRRLCTTFPPTFSCTTHHRQSTYTHNISPSSLYGEEEGCARHSHLFFHAQLITANQLTPTTSRHHLYMGKKVVHDIHPIFSCTTHHRQSTYTHNISPSSLYGEEEGCARHSHLFFHAQLITANQLTPTTSRHHLYMGKKVVHDIPTYFLMHNSSPPINLHPQHLAIIFIWGRRLCTTFPPVFSCTTHHRQSTYTHNISPSSLYGEEGCARHSHLFFHAQLITANQLTPTTSRHHLYMGKKVMHHNHPYFCMHNSSSLFNLRALNLDIILHLESFSEINSAVR
ncbi:hypothetical protein KSF78_0009684, partial [Schistosoma japonicum]